MKIELKINEISSKVFSKVKSQLSYPPLNLKTIVEDTLRDLEETVCILFDLILYVPPIIFQL